MHQTTVKLQTLAAGGFSHKGIVFFFKAEKLTLAEQRTSHLLRLLWLTLREAKLARDFCTFRFNDPKLGLNQYLEAKYAPWCDRIWPSF